MYVVLYTGPDTLLSLGSYFNFYSGVRGYLICTICLPGTSKIKCVEDNL